MSLSEFFVTIVVSAAFLWHLDFTKYAQVVIGLIIGGAMAAPFAGWFSKTLPQRVLMGMVAGVIGLLALYNLFELGSVAFAAMRD